MSAAAQWWRRLGPGQRVVTAVVAVVVAANVILAAAGSLVGGDPGGPVSSSFSTGEQGLEGYADLLSAAGHPVERLRRAARASDLPQRSVVVLADPDELGQAEGRVLADHVAGGGTLVLAGEETAPLLGALTGSSVAWSPVDPARRLSIWVPVPEAGGARALAGDEGSRWIDLGGLLPVAGADGRPSMVVADVGEGRVVALADAAVLHNRNLDQADNARFGLGLAGAPATSVVFVESVHGYAGGGLAAVPPSWKWTTAGLVAALLVGLWAAGARFGPPEPSARTLRPPRLDHVEALAADLDRVTPRPADLHAALADGARAAHEERRARGIAEPLNDPTVPATVPADPSRAGARS